MTYKYRLYPKKIQKRKLDKILELCRIVYNETLQSRKVSYEENGETLSYYKTSKFLPKWKIRIPELYNVHSQVLQNVMIRVDKAFRAFFVG